MKLSRATSYALHALSFMAGQKSDRPTASHHIAEARHIPERFLLKVLRPLVSARMLLSVKGPNGGYRLARPADTISLLEVLEAVEGPIRGVVSLADDDRSPFNARLEAVCQQNADQTRKSLDKVKVSDLGAAKK